MRAACAATNASGDGMWGTIFACLLFLIGAGLMVAVETQTIYDKRREAAIGGIILMAVGAVAAIYFINQNARGFEFEKPKPKQGKGGAQKDREGTGNGGGGGRRERKGEDGEDGGENAFFGIVSKRVCPAKDNLVVLAQGFAQLPIASANGQPATQSVSFGAPFCMSIYEVTVAEYRAFADAAKRASAPCDGKPERTWRSPGFQQSDGSPVVCITIDDAAAYASWKSKEDRIYRLPTEAEWVYASGTSPGGKLLQKIPNAAGEVSEILPDCWRSELKSYPPSGAFAPQKGKCEELVARGGRVDGATPGGHSIYMRRAVPIAQANSTVGFRLARNTEFGPAK
jgi:Sulfatase-modifying factor enzyme 1